MLIIINLIIWIFKRILRRSRLTDLLWMINFNLYAGTLTFFCFSWPVKTNQYLWFILTSFKTFLYFDLYLILQPKIIFEINMLKKVNFLYIEQTTINLLILNFRLKYQIKYSFRKLKYFSLIKDFLLT